MINVECSYESIIVQAHLHVCFRPVGYWCIALLLMHNVRRNRARTDGLDFSCSVKSAPVHGFVMPQYLFSSFIRVSM